MNVLMIIADALRADHLGCYGYGKDTTPFIDELAKQGVLFRKCAANCDHTMPGLVTLFTGVDQVTHGIDSQQAYKRWEWALDESQLPFRRMAESGVKVSGCDPHVYGRTGYGLETKDVLSSIEALRNDRFFIWYRSETTHLPYNPAPPYDTLFLPEGYEMSAATKARLDIVRTHLIVHKPGLVSRQEQESGHDAIEKAGYSRSVGVAELQPEDIPGLHALYDGGVRAFDDEVRRYVEKLRETGKLEDTLIIITADHGEELMDRGAVGHSSCSLQGTLYDENIMIPLILWSPALPSGVVVDDLVAQRDVMPTLLDLLGLAQPAWQEGRSLLPAVNGEANPNSIAFAMTQRCGWQALDGDHRMLWCARRQSDKLIFNCDPDAGIYSFEYYDLERDPGERHNRYSRRDPRQHELAAALADWIGKSRYDIDLSAIEGEQP